MGSLNFRNNKKTYQVNDGAEISFNPADINFAKRLYDVMNKLETIQNEEVPDLAHTFEVARRRDVEIRAQIDAAFEAPVCDKVFGSTNVLSPAGGLPVCVNFLLAVIDEIEAAAGEETKLSGTAAAYIQKYEAKYGKYVKK